METVFGAMKVAAYTVLPYLAFARRTHRRMLFGWSDELQFTFEDVKLAVKRGSGPVERAGLYSLESLRGSVQIDGPLVPRGPLQPGRLAV
eukprot:15428849-Heterocapsa_arctica.AAC.1